MHALKETLDEKRERLVSYLRDLGSVVVAYSGGVDSSYLLAAALDALGPEQVLAVTADSPTYPASEREAAAQLADHLGVRQRRITTHELEDPNFANNPPERCYFCKGHLFEELNAIAQELGLNGVVYGATLDDLGDHRPGMRAAKEAGARAPLLDAGLTKDDVRALSRERGLPTWDKPAMACLASRFPYQARITAEGLGRVEAAEEILRGEFGLRQVRVRHHDTVARLEIEVSDFPRLLDPQNRQRVVARLKELGYSYVTLDLAGFRSGSMNEVLPSSEIRPATMQGERFDGWSLT
jgi:pyridinium-3,5-biscarboxylic acid mononucleotide sulfurtransferase